MIIIGDAQDLQNSKDVVRQIEQEEQRENAFQSCAERGTRHCSKCGATGHNARTCQIEVESTEEPDNN